MENVSKALADIIAIVKWLDKIRMFFLKINKKRIHFTSKANNFTVHNFQENLSF